MSPICYAPYVNNDLYEFYKCEIFLVSLGLFIEQFMKEKNKNNLYISSVACLQCPIQGRENLKVFRVIVWLRIIIVGLYRGVSIFTGRRLMIARIKLIKRPRERRKLQLSKLCYTLLLFMLIGIFLFLKIK